jgi:uncharacterized protein YeeX (DUF496 family)
VYIQHLIHFFRRTMNQMQVQSVSEGGKDHEEHIKDIVVRLVDLGAAKQKLRLYHKHNTWKTY